jgi:hypothetical protein
MKVMLRALLLIAVGLSAVAVFAQTKTVTNATLKKFSDERVQADKDLRQNYEQLGFSSPEERERRLEGWKRENQELVDKWEQEQMARQNAEALADQGSAIDRLSQSLQTANPGYNQGYNQGYNPGYNTNEYWGYGGYIDPSGNYGLRFPGRPGYYPNGYPYERYGYDPYYNPPSGTVSGGMYWPGPSPGRPPVYYRPRPYVRPRH